LYGTSRERQTIYSTWLVTQTADINGYQSVKLTAWSQSGTELEAPRHVKILGLYERVKI